jgi:hypothetical protein
MVNGFRSIGTFRDFVNADEIVDKGGKICSPEHREAFLWNAI